MAVDTIHHDSAFAVRAVLVIQRWSTLSRRLLAMLVAVLASFTIVASALASPQDVINDFNDNGQIDTCHPLADYDAALASGVDQQYAAFPDVVDTAKANPALVGTAEQPCPQAAAPPADEDSGVGVSVIAIAVGLVVVVGALVLGRRRRSPSDQDGPGASE